MPLTALFALIRHRCSALAVVLLACGGVSHAANVTWTGATNSDWMTGTNWSNGTGPVQGDVAIINAGNVVFSTGTTPGYNALRHLGGTLTFSSGTFNCANNSAWDSHVNATLLHTGTVAVINELEIGRTIGATGLYTLSGGSLNVSRGLNGYSLYLGGNKSAVAGGAGTLEISGGTFITRSGVKLGDATLAGTGKFTVLGSAISQIGIAASNTDTDGTWKQHAGSTLQVGIDFGGVTPIFITDSASTNGAGTNGTSATFEAGSLLEVGYYSNGYGGGTWTVMEVENGRITNNGLAFAPGVNTNVWSFSIDNAGANGRLKVTANGAPAALELTVGSTKKQKMRFGLDYERLWFWSGSTANKNTVARWSMVDCDVDYIRVAINAKHELTEGVFDLDAYFDADDQDNNDRIIPMMQAMKAAKPDIKFFASPRPLNEAESGADWQPYPRWITGQAANGGAFSFNPQKCAEYLVRYVNLMKTNGLKIDFIDMSNEWNLVEPLDIVAIRNYMVTNLAAGDMPLIVANSAWSYSQGVGWLNSIGSTSRPAIDIAACHNTDKTGTAAAFALEAADELPGKEVWNTEVHGWKSTSGADEVLSSAYMFECIRAGFSGLNGWLAIGQPNQGHCYIINTNSTVTRNVKYFIFRKLTTTANYGNALDINQPAEFSVGVGGDQADAGTSTAALIRDNLMTVWIMNHSANTLPIRINLTGRTLSETTVKRTRWSEVAGLPVEGVAELVSATTNTSVWSSIAGNSVYCYELLLNPIGPQFTKIEAENFAAQSGTTLETTGDTGGGQNVTNISRNDWLRFDNLPPGTGSNIRFRVARPAGRPDSRIEVRLDATNGTVLGSIAVPETGGWQTYETIEATLAPVTNSHSIYLRFVENGSTAGTPLCNLNWLSLILPSAPTNFASNPVAATSTQAVLTWAAVPGATGYEISRSTNSGGPYAVITNITGNTFTNTGLTTGTSYYYVIRALYGAVASSTTAEIRTVPSSPIVPANYTITSTARQSGGATNNLIITIAQSGLGQFYKAISSDTLPATTWTNEGSILMGTGGQIQFTRPIAAGSQRKFFRVRVWRE